MAGSLSSQSRRPAARPSQVADPVAVPDREFTALPWLEPPPSPSRGRTLEELPELEAEPSPPQLPRGWVLVWLDSWRCRPE